MNLALQVVLEVAVAVAVVVVVVVVLVYSNKSDTVTGYQKPDKGASLNH